MPHKNKRAATLLGPIRVNMHPIIEAERRVKKPTPNSRCFKRVPADPGVTFVQVVGAVERHLDGCLGIRVLGLQHFDGFSQLDQLGLLGRAGRWKR